MKKSSHFLYAILSPVAVLLFCIVFFPRIKGRENIPKSKGAVIAGNHLTVLDCFMVMAGTRRCIHFLAKAELFKFAFTNWFFRNAGVIPVYRNGKDKKALQDAIHCLNQGSLVGIFPEGRVNKKFETPVLPFKIGAVKMASETNSPIVPFTINGKYIPFARSIEIIFHKPYYVTNENLEEENKILVRKVCSELNDRKK